MAAPAAAAAVGKTQWTDRLAKPALPSGMSTDTIQTPACFFIACVHSAKRGTAGKLEIEGRVHTSNGNGVSEKHFRYLADRVLEPLCKVREQQRTRDMFHHAVDGGESIRVSVDRDTDRVIECIKKGRKTACMGLTSRQFRVASAIEEPVPIPTNGAYKQRLKHRTSYSIDSWWRIDLTVVDWDNKKHATSYEVELELVNTRRLEEEVAKADNNQPNQLNAIALCMLSHLHVLSTCEN